MGNKQVEKASMIGDLVSISCDNQGNEESKVTFKNVAVIPDCGFNLFSITKRLKNGWTMHGSKSMLVLKKDKFEIKFDIVVNTPQGMLLVGYFKIKQMKGHWLLLKQQLK
jgi:hypothetical protein